MYLVQLVPKIVHQIRFNQAMSPQHLQGNPLAFFRQSYASIFPIVDRAFFNKALRHVGHGGRAYI